jgi:hypothetical protein
MDIKLKKVESANIHYFDLEELACKVTGLDYDEIDADSAIIEETIHEVFDCSMDTFGDIVARLLPLVDVGASPLTEKVYKGFSDTENKVWLIKMEAALAKEVL